MVAVHRNELVNARAHIDAAGRAESVLGAQIYPGMSSRALARVLKAEGDDSGASELLRGTWDLLAAVGDARRAGRGRVGRRRRCGRHRRRTRRHSRDGRGDCRANPTLPRYRTSRWPVRGISDGSADVLVEAVAAFDETERRVDAAEVATAAGEALLAAGRREEAVVMLGDRATHVQRRGRQAIRWAASPRPCGPPGSPLAVRRKGGSAEDRLGGAYRNGTGGGPARRRAAVQSRDRRADVHFPPHCADPRVPRPGQTGRVLACAIGRRRREA